jgi:hypothetical protein
MVTGDSLNLGVFGQEVQKYIIAEGGVMTVTFQGSHPFPEIPFQHEENRSPGILENVIVQDHLPLYRRFGFSPRPHSQ